MLLSTSYTADFGSFPNTKVASLGLGSCLTWHGTPDMRVRMNDYDTNVLKACGGSVYYDSGSDSDLDSASIESNGMSSLFEGKIDYRISNTPKLAATCVTASFTEHHRHPELNSLVPTILMDKSGFRICLYDCEADYPASSIYNNVADYYR